MLFEVTQLMAKVVWVVAVAVLMIIWRFDDVEGCGAKGEGVVSVVVSDPHIARGFTPLNT